MIGTRIDKPSCPYYSINSIENEAELINNGPVMKPFSNEVGFKMVDYAAQDNKDAIGMGEGGFGEASDYEKEDYRVEVPELYLYGEEVDYEKEDYLEEGLEKGTSQKKANMHSVVKDGYKYVNVESLNRRLYSVTSINSNGSIEWTVTRNSDDMPMEVEHKSANEDVSDLSRSHSGRVYQNPDYNTYININQKQYRHGIDEDNNEYIITCEDDPSNNSHTTDCKKKILKGLQSGKDDDYCKNPNFYKTAGFYDKEVEKEPMGVLPKVLIGLTPLAILLIGFLVTNKAAGGKKMGLTNIVKYLKNGATTTLVTTGFLALIVLVVVMLIKSNGAKDNWCHDPYHKNSIKSVRTQKRGLHISMVLAGSAAIQALLKMLGADESTLLLLYGFILASVFGFMGDKMIGTDEGYSIFTKSKTDVIKYALGSLTGSSFFRYIITVFLDLFISMPIQMTLTYLMKDYIAGLTNKTTGIGLLDTGILSGLTSFVGNNFDNILQSIVAIITFMAYTNETRFLWAYPDKSLLPEDKIPAPTIKLATSVAAAVYLITNYPKDVAGTGIVERYIYVMVVIILLTLGSMGILFNIEPESKYTITKRVIYNPTTGKHEIEEDVQNVSHTLKSKEDVIAKWKTGGFMFAGLLFMGIGVPLIIGKSKK
jgi:hypothetical protein